MAVRLALLEEWMRDYYFETDIDLGSSGVQTFSLARLRELIGLDLADLDRVVFDDSQTLGGTGVRAALAQRFAGGDVDRVMVTHGSSEAIFLTMSALLRPGDEVIAVDPAYQQLYGIAESVGCHIRRWPLRFEDGFEPDLDALRALVNPRTRMVVVNFPHNPTGTSLSPERQRELVEIVADVDAHLVWDAAFAEITYDRSPLPDPGGWYDRTISYGTLSKTYGLPGLRFGWCLASPETLESCVRLRDYVSLHLSPLVELIAERVIASGDRIIEERRRLATGNLALVDAWMSRHAEYVEWVPPRGGVCAFPRFPHVRDIEDFCRRLGRERRVLLVPGTCFGLQRHARLGFGASTGELETGLARLADMLEAEFGPLKTAGRHG
jgi:capreomycidine synthase